MLLLPQVKRETLQAMKYVELLLVADYAEVTNGIMFIPPAHRAQSEHPTCSISWGGKAAGAQQVSFCHLDGPAPRVDRETCVFVIFVLAAMITLPPLSATFGQGRDAGCDVNERLGLEVSSGLPRHQ